MKQINLMKQIIVILYSIVAIVLGLVLGRNYDSFEFLIPISIANMFTFYTICYLEEGINWKGLCIYFALLFLTFAILLCIPAKVGVDEIRFVCMNWLSVTYTIIGVLAGGIARYKIERYERKKGEADLSEE